MALKIFLKHPWYASDGLYRRVEDNPHVVDLPLAEVPSGAEIEDSAGKRALAWKLRGDPDPATRQQAAFEEAEARKQLPLARALSDPRGTAKVHDEREKDLERREAELAKREAALQVSKDDEAEAAADEAARKAEASKKAAEATAKK